METRGAGELVWRGVAGSGAFVSLARLSWACLSQLQTPGSVNLVCGCFVCVTIDLNLLAELIKKKSVIEWLHKRYLVVSRLLLKDPRFHL